MVRTIIQLTEKQAERLRRRAKAENVSMSELVRRGVDVILSAPRLDAEIVRRAKAAAGSADLGLADLSARHDDHFAEALRR